MDHVFCSLLLNDLDDSLLIEIVRQNRLSQQILDRGQHPIYFLGSSRPLQNLIAHLIPCIFACYIAFYEVDQIYPSAVTILTLAVDLR